MLDTPAYWKLRCMAEPDALHGFVVPTASIYEEVIFCLLGGFGITAEMNVAAFERLKSVHGSLTNVRFEVPELVELLTIPLAINGRYRKYRYPYQRSQRVHRFMTSTSSQELARLEPPAALSKLMSVDGIGPKTAAWIIRNHFGSDDVAILDVHVVRACVRMGIFPSKPSLPRDYAALEKRFLELARAIGVRPAILDAVMWSEMRAESPSLRYIAA